MPLEAIADVLYQCKPPLAAIDVSRVHCNSSALHHRAGALMASYATHWLGLTKGFDFDTKLPRKVAGLQVQQNRDGGVDIFRGKPRIAEYEQLGYWHGHPTIVEVKAGQLNGYANRLQKHLEIAQRVYARQDVNALLFIPYERTAERDLLRLTDRYSPHLQTVDLQFTRKEIEDFLTANKDTFGINCKAQKTKTRYKCPLKRKKRGRRRIRK